jgi:hypothetical protein
VTYADEIAGINIGKETPESRRVGFSGGGDK